MKKIFVLLMAMMLLLNLLAGCKAASDPADATTPSQDTTPTEAPNDSTTTEDPASSDVLRLRLYGVNDTNSGFRHAFSNYNYLHMFLLYETLLGYNDTDDEIVNVLAESYEMSPDGKTWTVVLKDTATFHDGEPVTAEDVAFSFAANIGCAGASSNQLASLKGYQAVVDGTADRLEGIVVQDEKTIVFEFETPNYLFYETMYCNAFSIYPAHCFEGMDFADIPNSDFWASPVGSGPYMIKEANWPDYVLLTARDDYHMGTPGIKEILMTNYTDDNAFEADTMAGLIHVASSVNQNSVDTVTAENPAMEPHYMDSGYTRYIAFNMSDTGRPEMRSAEVRKAINMIIDKQMIVDYIGVQAAVATNQSALFFNTDIPRWQRDVEGGKKLLEEAGFDFSVPLRLYTDYKDQQSIDILDIIVANLAEAGVTLEYVFGGDNAVAKIYEIKDWDMYYGGGMGIAITNYNTWSSGQLYDAWYNPADADYRYARYQQLFNDYRATADADARQMIYDQIQMNAMEDMYIMGVWHRSSIWLVDEDLTGFTPWPTDYNTSVWRDVTQWSLAE